MQVLEDEQELARRLLHMFDDEQREVVVYADEAPEDIETREIVQVEPGPPRGLSVREMNEGQADLLMQLVEEYAYRVRPELADAELAEISKSRR